MRKRIVWVAIGLLLSGTVRSQTATFSLGDLVGQKKKQTKRMLEQVALLQVYMEVLQKGYRIVQDGLQLVNDIKHGDFNLHNGYFTSLGNINPAIKNYVKVEAITGLYQQIAQLYRQTTKLAKDPVFSGEDRDAVERIFAGLLQKANDNLQEVNMLTMANHFELKDDERLQRIEGIWRDMKEKYAFVKDFSHSVTVLLVQKKKEQRDAEGTGKLLDIHK